MSDALDDEVLLDAQCFGYAFPHRSADPPTYPYSLPLPPCSYISYTEAEQGFVNDHLFLQLCGLSSFAQTFVSQTQSNGKLLTMLMLLASGNFGRRHKTWVALGRLKCET